MYNFLCEKSTKFTISRLVYHRKLIPSGDSSIACQWWMSCENHIAGYLGFGISSLNERFSCKKGEGFFSMKMNDYQIG